MRTDTTDATDAPIRKRFTAAVEFTKDASATTDDGTITIKGYASTWSKDRDHEWVDKSAYDGSWAGFIEKNPMMLYQHNPDWPIGHFADGGVDKYGLGVTGVVPPPTAGEIPEVVTAYKKIADGTLRTFSVGGFMTKRIKDGKAVITDVDLYEISVVTVPANGDALFTVAKRFAEGEDGVELAARAKAQMEQLLGFRPLTDPELQAMSADEVADQYTALSELFKAAYGASAPPQDAWLRVLKAKNAGVAVPIVAKAAAEVVRSFYVPEAPALPDEKAGRALSSANEAKLRKARQHIDDVIAAVQPMPQVTGDSDVAGIGEPVDAAVNPLNVAKSASAIRAKASDGETYRDLQAALQAAVREQQPDPDHDGDAEGPYGECDCWVEDFSDSWVVYYHDGQLYRSEWSRDGNDMVIGDATPVRTQTSYVELALEFDIDGGAIVDMGNKGALPLRKLGFAKSAASWDADAARDRVKEWSGAGDTAPNAKYAQAFLWRDGDGATFTEYRFPVADVVDGKLVYVPKAIEAAAGAVGGARGGTSDEVAEAIKPKLEKLYAKMAVALGDESIKAPWEADS